MPRRDLRQRILYGTRAATIMAAFTFLGEMATTTMRHEFVTTYWLQFTLDSLAMGAAIGLLAGWLIYTIEHTMPPTDATWRVLGSLAFAAITLLILPIPAPDGVEPVSASQFVIFELSFLLAWAAFVPVVCLEQWFWRQAAQK